MIVNLVVLWIAVSRRVANVCCIAKARQANGNDKRGSPDSVQNGTFRGRRVAIAVIYRFRFAWLLSFCIDISARRLESSPRKVERTRYIAANVVTKL